MRLLLSITVFTLMILCASSALAVDFPCADNSTDCSGDPTRPAETAGDGTGGTLKPPIPFSCTATRLGGTGCRSCEIQYADNGQPTAYTVCAYVTRSAACACKMGATTCTPQGSCTYFR